MFCHLSSLAGYVVPFGNLLGPLVVWLVSREKHPFIDDQGKESLNFQITLTLLLLISGILVCVGIGIVLLIVAAVYGFVMPIVAAVKSNKGELYRYPATLRLIT
ncbi:MAG: DUF4870 domain-containing protein [Planctomycetia bacterium]|nr:DUF4870 domain-containing protein [Planctomycetia bacterium]